MFLFFETCVYNNIQEQQEQEQQEQEQQEQQQQEENPLDEFNNILEPMKRYYLVSKIINLKNNLDVINYKNPVLGVLVKFIDHITYEHLIIIVPKLLEIIQKDLKRINNEKK